MDFLYITEQSALNDFCAQIKNSAWLTLDTEFIREKTYYPELCLIQIANQEHIACIDPLQLSDLSPLTELLDNPNIIKVLHASSQDLEIFYHLSGTVPKPVFDTQIAASILGHGEQIGYGNLVSQVLDITLDKAHARTDWSKRPLDAEQLDYAADDVRYLRDVYLHQLEQLEKQQRLDWLEDDFKSITQPERYFADPRHIWQKVKGSNRLKGKNLAVLRELADWREQLAIKKNRPRRWILADDALVDLAKAAPQNLTELAKRRGLSEHFLQAKGDALISAIQLGLNTDKADWPQSKSPAKPNNVQAALVDAMASIVQLQGELHTVSPSNLASKKDLERLVAGETNLNLLKGWRKKLIGEVLLDFLSGKHQLACSNKRLEIVKTGQ